MADQIENIEKLLYDHYYRDDQTPDNLVSSYWRESFKKMNVQEKQGRADSFKGYNFGDMQCSSWQAIVLRWITIASYLIKLNNRMAIIKMMRIAMPLAKRMGFPFTYDCFRQVCTFVMLSKDVSREKQFNVIIIGDGYGFLASLIKEVFPNARVHLIDLGKTLIFQCHYCHKAHPGKNHYLINNDGSGSMRNFEADFTYCPAENLHKLDSVTFDWAVNIVSMQEMNNATIQNYFDFLRKHITEDHFFYCCNREEKIMPGGEVSHFMSYPWHDQDRHLIDEICPWQKHIITSHRTENGPTLFNRRIPFINYFDGNIRHRLSVLQRIKK